MIAVALIAALLTIIAAKGRHVGPALVLGIATVAVVAAIVPGFVSGFGTVLGHIATGIGDGLTHAAG
jgi:Flp pilus assembly pilin Flp